MAKLPGTFQIPSSHSSSGLRLGRFSFPLGTPGLAGIIETVTKFTQNSLGEGMRAFNVFFLLLFQAPLLLLAGCSHWQHEVVTQNVAFTKVRIENNGLVIGQLKKDTVIGGRPCKQGWVHIGPNGVPVGFTASRTIDLGRFVIPSGTWVFQNGNGEITVCAFPRDTDIQGHMCRGSGGPKGVQAAFYPDGSLKEYFLRQDTLIQGIPCKGGLFNRSIHLHKNGRLKECVLSEELARDGCTYSVGTHLHFDSDGHIIR
jgi:hypothetical protein